MLQGDKVIYIFFIYLLYLFALFVCEKHDYISFIPDPMTITLTRTIWEFDKQRHVGLPLSCHPLQEARRVGAAQLGGDVGTLKHLVLTHRSVAIDAHIRHISENIKK